MLKAVRAIILDEDRIMVMHRNKFGREYDILIGGGVEIGETPEQALFREIKEEVGIGIADPRLVFIERAGVPYGDQLVFLCRYVSGDINMDKTTNEFKINLLGLNTYKPVWRSFKEFESINFRSPSLHRAVLEGIKHGFPIRPIDITNT